MSIIDLSLDAGDDLIAEALPSIMTDREREHFALHLAKVARSLDQYSHAK
jgi:hypothetical protein